MEETNTTFRRTEETFWGSTATSSRNNHSLARTAQTTAFAEPGSFSSARNCNLAFVPANASVGLSDGDLAFADAGLNESASNTFARPQVTAAEGEWAFSPWIASVAANSGGWAFEILS